MSIEPEMLMAYADGELDPLAARRVERAIAADPALAAEVERHRALRSRIGGHFAGVAGEAVPAQLEALLASNVVPMPQRRAGGRLRHWRGAGALAASLVVGLMIGQAWQRGGIAQTRGGQLYASGPLDRALDKQLANSQGPITVPITFRNRQGAYCRIFTSQQLDGLACRGNGGWALRQTRTGAAGADTEYAQAGSAAPGLMAAAQGMMAGAPLDLAAETNAKRAGWR